MLANTSGNYPGIGIDKGLCIDLEMKKIHPTSNPGEIRTATTRPKFDSHMAAWAALHYYSGMGSSHIHIWYYRWYWVENRRL
jgi:hypothetical protein